MWADRSTAAVYCRGNDEGAPAMMRECPKLGINVLPHTLTGVLISPNTTTANHWLNETHGQALEY